MKEYKADQPIDAYCIGDVKALLEMQTKRWKRRASGVIITMLDITYFSDNDVSVLANIIQKVAERGNSDRESFRDIMPQDGS